MNLTSAEREVLYGLIEHGPLWDGDVPSKVGRDALIIKGLAVRVVVKCEDGFTAATYAGRDAYKALLNADTMRAANNKRHGLNEL